MSTNDGTYEACLSYLNAKGHTLWGDYSLNPNEDGSGHYKNEAAAHWLEAQVRGVAEHYDTPTRTYGTASNTEQTALYAGPYSTERNGGGKRPARQATAGSGRPSALITHGQQAERW